MQLHQNLNGGNQQSTETMVKNMTTPYSTTDDFAHARTYANAEAPYTPRMSHETPWDLFSQTTTPPRDHTTNPIPTPPACPSNADNSLSTPNPKPDTIHVLQVYTNPVRAPPRHPNQNQAFKSKSHSCSTSLYQPKLHSNHTPTVLLPHPPIIGAPHPQHTYTIVEVPTPSARLSTNYERPTKRGVGERRPAGL